MTDADQRAIDWCKRNHLWPTFSDGTVSLAYGGPDVPLFPSPVEVHAADLAGAVEDLQRWIRQRKGMVLFAQ